MAKPQFNYYRAGRSSQAPSPFNKKAPSPNKNWRSRLFDWLFFLAIVACLIYSLIVSSPAKVTSASWPYRPQAVYKAASDKYLGNLKNKTKLSFDQGELSQGLSRQFPEISDVVVELPLFSEQPVIHLAISPPQFMLASSSQRYILNSEGVIVGQASNFPQLKNLPTLTDQSGYGVKVGQRLLSSSEVSFINQVLLQSKHAGISVVAATLPAKAQELDIKASDQPYIVKFYLGGDAARQIGQFIAARHQFEHSQDKPQDYLDVRINGKIYYK